LIPIGSVLAALMWPERRRLEALTRSDLSSILSLSLSLTLKLLGSVVAMLAVVAAADYLFQYRQWHERQKMSVRELKEEFKRTEGDQRRDEAGAAAAYAPQNDRRRPKGRGSNYQPDTLCHRARI
jgi:flagellar biosynthesis protein FlhB